MNPLNMRINLDDMLKSVEEFSRAVRNVTGAVNLHGAMFLEIIERVEQIREYPQNWYLIRLE